MFFFSFPENWSRLFGIETGGGGGFGCGGKEKEGESKNEEKRVREGVLL